MSFKTARDLMVSRDGFPEVDIDANLGEAVVVMEGLECPHGMACSRHHNLLVTGSDGQIEGWLGMTDVLSSLDPRFHSRKGLETINAPGVNPDQIRKLVESFGATQSPLSGICEKAKGVRIGDLMHRPGEDQLIDAGATIDEVVTRLVNDNHPIVLVTDGGEIIGALRLDDVFEAVSDAMRQCST